MKSNKITVYWVFWFLFFSKLKTYDQKGLSPGCSIRAEKSMVLPSSRGGVPVFNRERLKP